MRPVALRERLVSQGARFAELRHWEIVRDYGSRDAEWRALSSGAGLQDRTGRALIRLTGPDRVTFLHGQTTNEVNKLEVGTANEAVLLTNRGKMLGDGVVLKRADDLWLRGEVGYGPDLLTALQRNCISEEVELEDLTDRTVQLGLYGPESRATLVRAGGGPLDWAAGAHREVTIAGGPVTALWLATFGPPGFELFVPPESALAVWGALIAQGAQPFGEDAYELTRISAGIPRYGVDMTEETNPLEANLERAISYQKGCYVGQEVIAKATFRGHVTRKLTGLRFAQEPAAPSSELSLEGRVVGRVTSSVRRPDGVAIGLAFVKRDLAKPDVKLVLADGSAATTCSLPLAAAAP